MTGNYYFPKNSPAVILWTADKMENKINYNVFNSSRWIKQLHETMEPVTIVLSTHLMIEHGIDYLIAKYCKNKKNILENHNTWTFANKLDLLYEMNKIPEYLYQNIKKLNKIRNAYSHNLDVDFNKIDLNFIDPDGKINLKENKDINTKKKIKGILIIIGLLTFKEINALIIHDMDEKELGKIEEKLKKIG